MRQVFCVNILDFLPCANLIILYYILFIGSFKLIFKQLQYFGGGLIEATLHPLRVRTLQNRVIVVYEALKRIFIRGNCSSALELCLRPLLLLSMIFVV